VPYSTDKSTCVTSGAWIFLVRYLDGAVTVKEHLYTHGVATATHTVILRQIGETLSRLHTSNIIPGVTESDPTNLNDRLTPRPLGTHLDCSLWCALCRAWRDVFPLGATLPSRNCSACRNECPDWYTFNSIAPSCTN
jgi:hypothetical protein